LHDGSGIAALKERYQFLKGSPASSLIESDSLQVDRLAPQLVDGADREQKLTQWRRRYLEKLQPSPIAALSERMVVGQILVNVH
jgi:hypothetical protein